MVALQIRDVPEDVRDVLAEAAKQRGQSLQAFLLSLVVDEAGRRSNLALLERMSGRNDGFRSTTGAETLRALEDARGRRDQAVGERNLRTDR